jgi:hypothetical protein
MKGSALERFTLQSVTSLIVWLILLLAGDASARASALTPQDVVPLPMAAVRNQCIEFTGLQRGSPPGTIASVAFRSLASSESWAARRFTMPSTA